jgi:hypothetical protein
MLSSIDVFSMKADAIALRTALRADVTALRTLLHRQTGLGAVERLDLALLIYREDDGVGGRIDINSGSFDSLNVRIRCGASW